MIASADAQLGVVLDDAVLASDHRCKTWGGQTYKDVFTGETLVDVLLLKDPTKYPNRETAVQYAQGLLDTQVITCITKRRTFDDGDRLYCVDQKKAENNDDAMTVKTTTTKSPSAKVATEGKQAESQSDKTTLVNESRLSVEPSGSRVSSNLSRLLEKDASQNIRTGQRDVSVTLKDKQCKAPKYENLASMKMNTVSSKISSEENTRGLTSEKVTVGNPGAFSCRATEEDGMGNVSRCLSGEETSSREKRAECDPDNGGVLVGKQKLSKTLSPALTALIEKDAKGRPSAKEGGIQELGKVKQELGKVKHVDEGARTEDEPSRSWHAFELKLQKKVKTKSLSPGRDVNTKHEGSSVMKKDENGRITFERSRIRDEEEKGELKGLSSLEKHEFLAKEEMGKLSVTSDELLMVSVKERKNSFLGRDESRKAREEHVERKSTCGKMGTGPRESGPSFSLREDSKPVIIEEAVENSPSDKEIPKGESGDLLRVLSRGDSKTRIIGGALHESNTSKSEAKLGVQREGSNSSIEFLPCTDKSSDSSSRVRVDGHVIPKTLAALLAKDGTSAREWDQGSEADETNAFSSKLKELKKTAPRVGVSVGISSRTKARPSIEVPGAESTSEEVVGKRENILAKRGHSKNDYDEKDAASVNDTTGKVLFPVFKTASLENNVASTVKVTEKSKATELESSKTGLNLFENAKKVQELSPRTPESPTVGFVVPHLNLSPSGSSGLENVSFGGGAGHPTRSNSFGISPTSKSSPLSPHSPLGLLSAKRLEKSGQDFIESKLKYERRITELQLEIDFLRRQKSGQIDGDCLDSSASMSDLTSLYSSFSTPVASPCHSNLTSPAVTPRVSITEGFVPFSPVSPPPPPPPVPPSVPSGPIVNGGGVKPTKSAVNPRVDMKPLFWSRIITSHDSGGKEKSVWKTIKEPVIDTSEFERLFSKKNDNRKLKRTKSLRDDKHFARIHGKKVAKLLETNRARAIGIKMSSLSCQLEDIRNAVYNMDTSVVDMESLQFIYDIYPKEDEIQLIEEHVNKLPAVPLDKPEEFMHQLTKMKHFKERLECWLFQEKFSEVVYGIDRSLACITESCSIISTNPEISAILGLILVYGNYMNGNTVRGQADGFNLDVLLKLRDVKNKESDMNLLQYIVKQYLKQHERSTEKGKSETRLPSSVSLFNAAQVSFHKLREELLKVSSLLQETEVQTMKILEECVPSKRNPFEDKMRHFQKMAKQNITEENGKMEKAVETFRETMEYFQWQPNEQKETLQEFFALWAKFIEDIKNCVKLEKQQQHQAKKNFSKVEHLDQILAAATKFKKRRESVDVL